MDHQTNSFAVADFQDALACRTGKKLPAAFYGAPGVEVPEVAENFLGKQLVFRDYRGIITEVEAYRGSDDPASHAYRGLTKRNAIMFGPPGYVYVYLIYGMYDCLNIVTEEAGSASAVLIRGLKLPDLHLNGPGKICRHLGITRQDHGTSVVESDHFYLTEGVSVQKILRTPRIGITKATDKLWRFCMDPAEILALESFLAGLS